MKYLQVDYTYISIPREVLYYFVHSRQEYLLRTLYYFKTFCTPEGYGYDISGADYSQMSEALQVTPQTIKNHLSKLSATGFIKPRKGTKDLFYVYGHKKTVEAVRRLQDTTRDSLGLGKHSEDKKYIDRLNSDTYSGYRLDRELWKLSSSDFRVAVQGALYTHNIRRQAYQQAKKAGSAKRSRVPNYDGTNTATADKGLLSCFVAGQMTGRSKMTGSRLRRKLKELGFIDLIEKSSYVGRAMNRYEVQAYKEQYEGKTLIPIPERTGTGFLMLLVECYETVLLPGVDRIRTTRIQAGRGRKGRNRRAKFFRSASLPGHTGR